MSNATLRERCKAMLGQLQRNAILRQGSPVDDLMAFVVAETGRSADESLAEIETRRAEDAHGEAQRWALQVESLRAEKEELKERCAKAADKVDTVNGIGNIIRGLP